MKKLESILAGMESFATSLDVSAGGTHFYGKISGGDLAFVHKRFAPCTASEIEKLKIQMGFSNLGSYEDLLLQTDGIILFNNRITIFGVRENPERSMALDKQTSISVSSALRRRGGNHSEWLPIGAVALYDIVLDIELNRSGESRLGAPSLGYVSFSKFVDLLLLVWDSARALTKPPEIVLPKVDELERVLRSVIRGDRH